jgi:hypothetical protein
MSATTARSSTNPERGSNSRTSSPPSPRTNPATTNTAVRERKLRLATPATMCREGCISHLNGRTQGVACARKRSAAWS